MKVYEFMAVITGSRRICFSDEKTPMTANESGRNTEQQKDGRLKLMKFTW